MTTAEPYPFPVPKGTGCECPAPGYVWRGKGVPGSAQGNWTNPGTGESLHPDLAHPDPIGPHWDYRDPTGDWWRLFPDGTAAPK